MKAFRATVIGAVLMLFAAGNWSTSAEETAAPVAAPLITKGRVQLNLAGAELILAAAKQKAAEMNLKLNFAIVDDDHMLAFACMDGVRPVATPP